MNITKKVKKITLGILGTAILASGLWACSNDENNERTETIQKIEAKYNDNFRYSSSDFNIVGETHNTELENAYEYLLIESLDNESKKDFIEDLDNYFLNLLPKIQYGNTYVNFISNKQFVTFKDFNNYVFLDEELSFKTDVTLSNLDHYLLRLESLIDNSAISEISELESDIYNNENISNEELFVFYNISSVSKYSMRYWKENDVKWNNLISKYNTKSNPPKDGWSGRVLKQDAMGAGAGAAYAWWVNAAPGAGQIAYGTAIGATSASFSAASLIDEFWPWD